MRKSDVCLKGKKSQKSCEFIFCEDEWSFSRKETNGMKDCRYWDTFVWNWGWGTDPRDQYYQTPESQIQYLDEGW